jgi:N-acetyl-gamma-glutamyl-phosphate reductase
VPLELESFDPDAVAARAGAALVAYPHKAAAPAVRALRERGLKVVDLSADFRLDRDSYERWYQPHEAPELLEESVYGLPEAHRDEIRAAELVAGPGCNSTAALLALLPLRGRIDDAVVDIKTGVSGAGREATEETHFVSATDNVNPYKTEGHRHLAELEQELPGVRFAFVPHLLPIDQGLLASCYVTPTEPLTRAAARELFEQAYAGEPFVELLDEPPHTRDVRFTNRASVYVTVAGDRVLSFCAIDNLWKGAAGQAVQDLNLMLGLPETEGLE